MPQYFFSPKLFHVRILLQSVRDSLNEAAMCACSIISPASSLFFCADNFMKAVLPSHPYHVLCSCHRNKKYLTSEMHFLLPKEKDSSLLLDFVKERETSSSHKFANIYYHVSSDWVTCSSLSQSLRSVESGINFDWSQPGLGSRAEGEDTSIHTVGWGKRRVRILQREIATWRRGYES